MKDKLLRERLRVGTRDGQAAPFAVEEVVVRRGGVRVRIGRPGESYAAGEWPEGAAFVTKVTRLDGIVLEHGHENVTVLLGSHRKGCACRTCPVGEEKRLHPNVLLEVPPGEGPR